MEIIKVLVALASVIFGIVSLWRPVAVANAAFLDADTPRGRAEIRASWGGMFIGLGLIVIVLNSYDAYLVFAAAYAATALVRIIGAIQNPKLITRGFYIILAFEVISVIVFALPT